MIAKPFWFFPALYVDSERVQLRSGVETRASLTCARNAGLTKVVEV